MNEATACHKAGDLETAARLYRLALDIEPQRPDALHMLGVVNLQQGQFEAAISLMSDAVRSLPHSADLHYDFAYALQSANRFPEAIHHYSRALALRPNDADARYLRATAALAEGQSDAAIEDLARALEDRPRFTQALAALASALSAQRRFAEVIEWCERTSAMQPDNADAHNYRGNALAALNRYPEAVAAYGVAIALRPDSPEALCNRGNALFRLARNQESADDFAKAVELQPDHVEALFGLGNATRELGHHEQALACYRTALAINPERAYLAGDAAHAAAQICDWQNDATLAKLVSEGIAAGRTACFPFVLLAMSSDPAEQLACATSHARSNYSAIPGPPAFSSKRNPKVRLAYLSADFRDHAVASLIAELFEIHDRNRFEVIGVSFGPDHAGSMRSRLHDAFDRFLDVRESSDHDVAAMMRDMEVDIAIDLMGYTHGERTGIMASRPAPVQVNFLGYTGTMGAHFIDYIIADPVVIPPEHERYYSERVVRLPDSFQVNDSTRQIADRTPERSELGLADASFVFCCFNSSFKIKAPMFDVWMRLLQRLDGSVLWMLDGGPTARRNLRKEAEMRGVDGSRIVFAPRAPPAEHLARQRAADLFVDSLPYNAHTGTSDALWAGLPVLTCPGQTFASRVAASLLLAMNVPELVVPTVAAYEHRALELATTPTLLADLRHKLALNRPTAPLFDTDRFRRHIEQAYLTMWDIHRRGLPPSSFSIQPC